MKLNSTAELIAAFKRGEIVVIMDDEDRENEGDLMIAAECVTPDSINFMARFGRGLICLTLTDARCRQLHLSAMVAENQTVHATNFTASIEAADGVTTGISAFDRALTIKTAVKADACAEDIVQPGHVFPIKAASGGVLTRAGHTEAGCDLAMLAGKEPAAVIVEILNDDGSMARRADLEKFAQTHKLKIGTIADLISYRLRTEMTIARLATCSMPTKYGDFKLYGFKDSVNGQVHIALVKGDIAGEDETLVRVHIADPLTDIFGSARAPATWPIDKVMAKIQQADNAALIILREPDQNTRLFKQN